MDEIIDVIVEEEINPEESPKRAEDFGLINEDGEKIEETQEQE